MIAITFLLDVALCLQPLSGAKAMFQNPAAGGPHPHSGIHYWLQSEDGVRMTEQAARAKSGRFTLHIRTNVGGGWLTVWDVSGSGRELTPKDSYRSGGGRWSGYQMSNQVYVVPGSFEFTQGVSPTHLVIVWARSQSEVAHSAARAIERVWDMPASMSTARESDESTPAEIGTYVVNRSNAGVSAEIVFIATSPTAPSPRFRIFLAERGTGFVSAAGRSVAFRVRDGVVSFGGYAGAHDPIRINDVAVVLDRLFR